MSEPDWMKTAREKGLRISETGVNADALAGRDTQLLGLDLPAKLSEREFTERVIAFARQHLWRVAHFRPARVRRGGKEVYETPVAADGKGFPDLVLVRRGELIVAELKVGKNKTTPEQVQWLDDFRETGCASGVWRPEQWPEIQRALQ